MQEQLYGAVPLVTVGFSPPDALAALAEHVGLTGRMLADVERVLYRRLGLRRVPVWQVYSPSTLWFYARAALRGRDLPRPVEDTRQMGGDFLLVDGAVVRSWRPRTPDDRCDPAEIAAAARSRTGT